MSTKKSKPNKHSYYMGLALMQAYKNLGSTKDNPSVGCVVVKNNSVISSGYTKINGRPHAEHFALNKMSNLNNSDLYVTLEPCSHYGKTSPCVNKIISKKIKRVFFSINDPDKRSFNKSRKKLKNKKINVSIGILSKETNDLYKSYIKNKHDLLPFVTAKIAISKDGFTVDSRNKWITNKYSRSRVHLMRSKHDCIVTSVKTVITDNSRLTCRIYGLENKSPSRIILDKNLRIPLTSNLLKTTKKIKTIIFYNKSSSKKIINLKKYKVLIVKMPLNSHNKFDLKEILKKLKSMGFSRIFLESGVNLLNNFLKEDLIDSLKVFKSNKLIGKYGSNKFKISLSTKKIKVHKVNLFGESLHSYKLK
jgi:diaminohydroxyphosphoribosylaminopyrimidine deaminase / 5-amino-6-(5-phosphoribosylamino)uracil reductase